MTAFGSIMTGTYGASVVWPFVNVPSGSVVYATNASYNGAHVGLTLQDTAGPVPGSLAPLWDGTNDYADIFTAALAGAWNPAALSAFLFIKVASGAWTDATIRYLFNIQVNGANRVYIRKNGTNNQLRAFYAAASSNKVIDSTAIGGSTDWNGLGLTAAAAADEFKFFINGSQVGSTLNTIGTWTASPIVSALVGSQPTAPSNVFNGHECYMALKFGLPVWTATDYTNMQADAATAEADGVPTSGQGALLAAERNRLVR